MTEIDIELTMLSLGKRQREVFLLIVTEAMPTKEIATKLHLSHKTVKNHISAVLQAFGARDRVHLVVMYWQHVSNKRRI